MIKINRHNYEELFLLYVDEELSPHERKEVELFVQQNPDLLPELEMLQHTKLLPDATIMFSNKSVLYRTSDVDITLSNYEEYFLLYLDNELTEKEKNAVEKFILQHPQLQDEFSLLKQTILQPEVVEYANKAGLYRSEKDEKRVVPFAWMRMAAAAAILGLIATVWWLVPANKIIKVPETATAKNSSQIKVDSGVTAKLPSLITKDSSLVAVTKSTNTVVEKSINNGNIKNNKSVVAPIKKVADEVAVNNKKPATESNAPLVINDQPKPVIDAPAIAKPTVVAQAKPQQPAVLKPLEEVSVADTRSYEASYATETRNALTQNASYKELDTRDDDTRSLYVGTMEINKDKLRGFFKKASRIFGGKAKDASNGEGKLQVAEPGSNKL